MTPLASLYNKLVNKGRIAKEDVPEEVDIEIKPTEEVFVPLGALTIPKITNQPVKFDTNGVCIDHISTKDIFEEILGENPMPENTKYSVIRIEKDVNRLNSANTFAVDITNVSDGFNLTISSSVGNNIKGFLFRIDIRVESSNYEPMQFSVYYNT